MYIIVLKIYFRVKLIRSGPTPYFLLGWGGGFIQNTFKYFLSENGIGPISISITKISIFFLSPPPPGKFKRFWISTCSTYQAQNIGMCLPSRTLFAENVFITFTYYKINQHGVASRHTFFEQCKKIKVTKKEIKD